MGLVERGGFVYRQEELIEASQLLAEDGPDYVVFRDTLHAVEITAERFHEPVYRATIEPVATSPEQMETILKAKFVDTRIARNDLSGEAQEVVQRAHGDGYSETHPYSAGYQEILKALHERAYLDGNIDKDAFSQEHGNGIVQYDGEYVEYRLRFITDSTAT